MIKVLHLKILVNLKKTNNMLIHIVTVVAVSGDHANIFFLWSVRHLAFQQPWKFCMGITP